jgi:hypothetical protein
VRELSFLPPKFALLSLMSFLRTRGGRGGKHTFIEELAEIEASPVVTKPSIVELKFVGMES